MAQDFGVNTTTYTVNDFLGGHLSITGPATLISGQNCVAGTVLGKIAKTCPTTGTAGTNTGNGTCGSVTMGALAEIGTYTLTCTAAATNSGTFQVKTPSGAILAPATVAVAYTSPHINFTIADGSTDFAVADSFTIAVAAGSGKYTILAPAAVDGSQTAVAILSEDCDASSADEKCNIYLHGEFISAELTWPAGITAGQKATATAQLLDTGLYLK